MSYAPLNLNEIMGNSNNYNIENDDNNFSQGLLGTASQVPTVSSTPMVQVVAPADLPEGYVFTAQFGDSNNDTGSALRFSVTVPPGGIEKGQTFSVPMPDMLTQRIQQSSTLRLPVGHWRDGLLGLCNYGLCHPHCWTACCCPTIAAGQVMSRMNLPWTGIPSNSSGSRHSNAGAFQILLAVTVAYWVVYLILNQIVVKFELRDEDNLENIGFLIIATIHDVWHWVFIFATAVWLRNLRRTVRAQSAIPATIECEDAVCSCCCPCLVAGQLLRHTTDYDVYPATCCTERGVPPTAPSIV